METKDFRKSFMPKCIKTYKDLAIQEENPSEEGCTFFGLYVEKVTCKTKEFFRRRSLKQNRAKL